MNSSTANREFHQMVHQSIEEEIAALRQEAEEAKKDPDNWEFVFVLMAKADELQAILDEN